MTFDDRRVQRLREALRGTLLLPAEGGYDNARKVFNGLIDRQPAAIVRCAGVADVIAGIHFARQSDMLVAIRGGGHSVVGNPVRWRCSD